MSGVPLSVADVRFINLVAARRVCGDPAASPAPPETTLAEVRSQTPALRAAELAAALLRPGALSVAALPTALLAIVCQLDRDGYRLVAPQGAAAGMIRGLRNGSVSVSGFAAWVEDRAISE
jgi:prophage maintenance system killer protein